MIGYRLQDRGSISCKSTQGLFFTDRLDLLEPFQLPVEWIPGGKQPERKPNHSAQSSAEVKIALCLTSTPPCLIK
jgi:hypothetical protein